MKFLMKATFACCALAMAVLSGQSTAFAAGKNATSPDQYRSILKPYRGGLPKVMDDSLHRFADVCLKGRRVGFKDIAIYVGDLNGDRMTDYVADFTGVKGPVTDECWDVPCDDEGCYITIFSSVSPSTYMMSYNARVSHYDAFVDKAEIFEGTSRKTPVLNVTEHTSQCLPADLDDQGKCQRYYMLEDRQFKQIFLKPQAQ